LILILLDSYLQRLWRNSFNRY